MGICLVVLFVLLLIPLAVVLVIVRPEQEVSRREQYEEQDPPAYYVVCEKDAGSISVPLETALISALGSVADADSPKEELCAMAILLRTQAVFEIEQTGSCVMREYADETELRERWGEHYDTYYAVFEEAVAETGGIIMTYDGKSIETAFHAVSAGKTRSPSLLGDGHVYHWKAVECGQDLMARD